MKTKLLVTYAAIISALTASISISFAAPSGSAGLAKSTNTTITTNTDNAASIVGALDTAYQLAVERNDWQAMERMLHPDFVLILGNGTAHPRAQLIETARNKNFEFEKQVAMPGTQVVRLFGKDTATVSALLWLKGKRNDDKTEFDFKLWYSDTYIRANDGWRYAFAQASLPIPKDNFTNVSPQ